MHLLYKKWLWLLNPERRGKWHRSSFNTRLSLYLARYKQALFSISLSSSGCIPMAAIRTVRLWQLPIHTETVLCLWPRTAQVSLQPPVPKLSFRMNTAAYSGCTQCQEWKDGAAVTYWGSWAFLRCCSGTWLSQEMQLLLGSYRGNFS